MHATIHVIFDNDKYRLSWQKEGSVCILMQNIESPRLVVVEFDDVILSYNVPYKTLTLTEGDVVIKKQDVNEKTFALLADVLLETAWLEAEGEALCD